MHSMNDFELKGHAEYAEKYPDHEASFFETMVIPPWAQNLFGLSGRPDADLLKLIQSYREHHVFDKILEKTHPIIIMLLYHSLLLYEKLLLSLDPIEKKMEISVIHNILIGLIKKYPSFCTDDLLSEKDIRSLLIILKITRKLDDDLKDRYMRLSKIKKLLARFYRVVLMRILQPSPHSLTVLACYINPYFQKPGGKNNKITKAANEIFNYGKQRNQWIMEYPNVAVYAIRKISPESLDANKQNAIHYAAVTFSDVAYALKKRSEILDIYSPEEQEEIIQNAKEYERELLRAEKTTAEETTEPTTETLPKRQHKEITNQANQMFECLYKNSRKFFAKPLLKTQVTHLKHILQIILNNEKDILPIIASYWHSTYRKFKVHSQSAKFHKNMRDYVEIIINFFNDKDVGREDDIKLKAFAAEFIGKCKNEKATLAEAGKLKKYFGKVLDEFIALK